MADKEPKKQPDAPNRGRHDYAALGFMCGLEIHQQLDTGKLFCRCPSTVVDAEAVEAETEFTLRRRLRPTESELGELDPAAAAEARRGLEFVYHGMRGHSCLVDADEEPPHDPDADALDIALTMTETFAGKPVDEVQFMRKLVIDGSNTSGFQRTGLVSLGGTVNGVGIWTLAVEEDSCRKLDADEEGTVHYTLDRLGIPLIEIATAPEIKDARHAQETSARIGALLRATGRVRRGLGTIRQDLNVSIAEGDRVEIKGVQDLRAIPRVVDAEIDRQLHLVKVRRVLHERGVTTEDLDVDPMDVTDVFADADSKVIRGALKSDGKVFVQALVGFAGLIQGETPEGPRVGKEFAGHAKRAAGVRGVFHSDELPAYGITDAEVGAVRTRLKLGEQDAFVLSAAPPRTARLALEAVRDRAIQALAGVPREVRNALPDDTTGYLRPLPGAARMYPETDVRPFSVTAAHRERIRAALPELPEESAARLAKQHKLSEQVATQLVTEGHLQLFDRVVAEVAKPAELSRLLLQTLPEIGAEGADTSVVDEAAILALVSALDANKFAKEALADVAKAFCDAPDAGIDGAIKAAGAEAVDEGEVETIISKIVEARAELVAAQGPRAMGPLMGEAMAQLRGKADGQLVSKILQAEIRKRTQ